MQFQAAFDPGIRSSADLAILPGLKDQPVGQKGKEVYKMHALRQLELKPKHQSKASQCSSHLEFVNLWQPRGELPSTFRQVFFAAIVM